MEKAYICIALVIAVEVFTLGYLALSHSAAQLQLAANPANSTSMAQDTISSTSSTSTSTTTSASTTSVSTTTTSTTSTTTTVQPNVLPTSEVTTFLIVPSSVSGDQLRGATYIPIETVNSMQVSYICEYLPYAFAKNRTFKQDPYTYQGQLALAEAGYGLASAQPSMANEITAFCN
jgi:hypothetical protein